MLRVWMIALGAIGAVVLAIVVTPLHAQEATPQVPEQALVSPFLSAEMAGGVEDVPILIVLRDQPDVAALHAVALSAANAATTSPEERRVQRTTYLYHALTAYALNSQANLRAWLEAQGIPYRAYYIVNMILVTGDAALVDELRQRPDVARLDANPQVDATHWIATSNASWPRLADLPGAIASPNVPDGVAFVHAPEVWEMGYLGKGIVVASQDTGVEWQHPALRARYRGVNGGVVDHTYSWHDGVDESSIAGCADINTPCDDHGHGTHTVGTMIGSTDTITYGVAPEAQWMGCRNMRNAVGTPASYTECFEFFLAPYPPGGDPFTDGQPALAPHIINNSWGCPPSEGCDADSLRMVVEKVRAAGIMVVASAGNFGTQGCSTVRDPIAIYDASFTVGAHDSAGNLAGFSSKGPVLIDGSGRLKPDMTAPGVSVLSTARGGGETTLSGTSMAAPHVAGAVALLWSAVPWLVGDPDLTEQVLLKSATPVLDGRCDDAPEPTSPNPAFGYGRLDVAAAVELALQPWHSTVTVTDSLGAPQANVAVSWTDARTGYVYTTTTDIEGSAVITPMLRGEYTLQVDNSHETVVLAGIDFDKQTVTGTRNGVGITFTYLAAPPSSELHLFLPIMRRPVEP